jgi:dipeptidyl-peptidase-4
MKKFIVTVLALLAMFNGIAQVELKKISLEDLNQNNTFSARSVRGIKSMKDGETYTVLERGGKIVKYSYSTGESLGLVFNAADFEINSLRNFSSYDLSADEKKILLATDITPIYRHSYTANNYVFDIEKNTIESLSNNGSQMLATFSPDGKQIAFVRDNNIFIKNLEQRDEKQITFDGRFNHIINGLPDWVYEEEFHLTTGFHWSPDSKMIAFYRFDESRVKLFNMPMFNSELYPENYSFKYPKAGEDNSIVTIHVYDLMKGETITMDVGPETDQYIARIKWMPNNQFLSMVRLNRLQNKVDVLLANPKSGESKVLYSESNKFYIEEPSNDFPLFTDDSKYFIISSERDGYNHIYLYGMDGKLIRQLTKGASEVKSIYGYDTKSKRIYYNALDNSPLRTSVFYVTLDGKKLGKLSTTPGSNSATFSDGYKYYIHFHSTVKTPPIVTLHNSTGKQIRVLEDNSRLKETLARYEMPVKEFFKFTTSEGIELNGYIVKPLNFNENNKYPVMLNQYSGPGSQTVVDRFRITWDEYLASEGYIVVCVDGRGTGGRGEEFKKITYGQLGYYESIDQIETGKYLQTLPFVDSNRIGIWGWSYGGYMSSLCLFKAPELFRMAIAVAPVTTWRFYDTIYTERYMGLPQDNPKGYDDNSPINHVDGLQGKLLMIHGTGDDNVHVQNAVEMAERLVQANKQFDMMLYPDKNHSIFGGNTRMHLYTLMSNYVKANL